MDDDYKKWEKACRKIRKENGQLLDGFGDWLRGKGLKEKTIENHLFNVDFYINHYLLYYDATPARDGDVHIGGFFGEWFIRKAMWASANSIKKTAVSLTKFYCFMLDTGRVEAVDLKHLRERIKERMPDWQKAVRRYDDLANETGW